MEHLIRSFTRVIRKVDNPDTLIASFPSLETSALTTPSSLTTQDRLRILDFPNPDTQSSNIAASSSLAKSDLLKRAVESPSQLTASEIDLLKERYWLGVSRAETRARSAASSALLAVSEDHWREVTDRLKEIRAPLYEASEAQAIKNTEWEAWRRLTDASQAQQRQEAESAMATARPWVKRLWEEDQGQKAWGYAVFVEPGVVNGGEGMMDEYASRRDAILMFARGAIRCGDTVSARWNLQRLDWPTTIDDDDDATGEEDDETKKRGDQNLADKDPFQKPREKFLSLRDRPPKRQRTADDRGAKAAASGGLAHGILQNVFLVITQDCVDSVLSDSGNVDDMWVWAVDPDYDAGGHGGRKHEHEASEGQQDDDDDAYAGHLRVRLQQLINNFFEARRFRSDEYPMSILWEAARRSQNRAFVSMKEEEMGLWTRSRDVGSALRNA